VLGGVVLARLLGVVRRMQRVPVRRVRVVPGGFVMPRVVVLGGFAMVPRGMLMMRGRLAVVLGALVCGHGVLE
jgi:hypothetical protein